MLLRQSQLPKQILQEIPLAVNFYMSIIGHSSQAREIAALQYVQTNEDSAGCLGLFKLLVYVVQLAARRRRDILNTTVKDAIATFLQLPEAP